MDKLSLYTRIGGHPTLEKVHQLFYDKVYAHPWLGKFFAGTERKFIESQQTDFMSAAFGGPEQYYGKRPQEAHRHMMITDELFELRSSMLVEALKEANVPEVEASEWIRIDRAFKGKLVKNTSSECVPQYVSQGILDFDKVG